jgi:hypothetical protein
VTAAKKTLKPLGILVTVSEMVYGFTKDGGSKAVLEAIDVISLHELPYFSSESLFCDLLNIIELLIMMFCSQGYYWCSCLASRREGH